MAKESDDHHDLAEATATHHVDILLACLTREYPYKTGFVVNGGEDCRPPREMTPVFFGCFDWHSAVHSHWALLRLSRRFPDAACTRRALAALERSFTKDGLDAELAFQRQEHRTGFEMPYGVAWFLTLAAELRLIRGERGPHAEVAGRWFARMEGLETLFRDRTFEWAGRLRYPIRSGQHAQSGFSLALALDWARVAGDDGLSERIRATARRHHLGDRDAPLAYEPSAYDFLSPSLCTADLMTRVLSPTEFPDWLRGFFGDLPRDDWFRPVDCVDPTDGKLSHFQGLNLSRAWMQERIAAALPPADARGEVLRRSARAHARAGMRAVTAEHYAGAHWLSSFAVYLQTSAPHRGPRT